MTVYFAALFGLSVRKPLFAVRARTHARTHQVKFGEILW